MPLEIFTGDSVPALLAEARAALGADACIVQVRRRGGRFELIASDRALAPTAEAGDTPAFGPMLASAIARPRREPATTRPRLIALVGPTGAGKTTTLVKLATNTAVGVGGHRVGLLGLDTYRVGAVEQLQAWADLAGTPCQVVRAERELAPALERLARCEVVLIDTPGRGPGRGPDAETVRGWLATLAPDEVHLAMPAGRMPVVTRGAIEAFRSWGLTHGLVTKVDECPDDERVFDVAVEAGLAVQWYTDGQDVPHDLHGAEAAVRAARARVAAHRPRTGAVA